MNRFYRCVLLGLLFISCQTLSANPLEVQVTKVLNTFHQAATEADSERYFAQLAEDSVFMGTDASERWSKSEFASYAMPYFDKGTGWEYKPQKRHIHFSAKKTVAWVDELLVNESYGLCRGTGVLELRDGRWLITQYNLSIPVPNNIVKDVVKQIRAMED